MTQPLSNDPTASAQPFDVFELTKHVTPAQHYTLVRTLLAVRGLNPALVSGLTREGDPLREELATAFSDDSFALQFADGVPAIVELVCEGVDRELYFEPHTVLDIASDHILFDHSHVDTDGSSLVQNLILDDGTVGVAFSVSIGDYSDDDADASATVSFFFGSQQERHSCMQRRVETAIENAVTCALTEICGVAAPFRRNVAQRVAQRIAETIDTPASNDERWPLAQ